MKSEDNGYFEEKEIELELEESLGNELMEKKWAFVQEVIEKGEVWTDPEFPPQLSSLINLHHDKGSLSQMRKIQWRRASEIFEEPQVFVDGISPEDIEQG